MGREVINKIKCAKCGREFDVATEDLEWEHAVESEAGDTKSGYPETGIMQKIECPNSKCRYKNTIVYRGIHNTDTGTCMQEVYSLELEILLDEEDRKKYNLTSK